MANIGTVAFFAILGATLAFFLNRVVKLEIWTLYALSCPVKTDIIASAFLARISVIAVYAVLGAPLAGFGLAFEEFSRRAAQAFFLP